MKASLVYVLLVLSLLVTACEEEADLFRIYTVKAGEHYATPRVFESLNTSRLSFDAKFYPNCEYLFEDAGYQDSKNKLLGFSECNTTHHENSARFAWQWLHNRLEIFAYCYVNGERVEKFVGVVELDEVNHYEIIIEENRYIFLLNDEAPVEVERGSVCNTGVYYMLYPYFGGTLPAPHDVNIAVKINN